MDATGVLAALRPWFDLSFLDAVSNSGSMRRLVLRYGVNILERFSTYSSEELMGGVWGQLITINAIPTLTYQIS